MPLNSLVQSLYSFGSFYSNRPQLIEPNQPFIFNTHISLLNINPTENTSEIIILQSGIYVINIIIHLKIAGTVAFLKNNTVINNSITYSNLGNTNILIHFITSFIENDTLKLINFNTSEQLICENSKNLNNLDLTIIKISPSYSNNQNSVSIDLQLNDSHKEWLPSEGSESEGSGSEGSEEESGSEGSGESGSGKGSEEGSGESGSGSGSGESGSEGSGSGESGSEGSGSRGSEESESDESTDIIKE